MPPWPVWMIQTKRPISGLCLPVAFLLSMPNFVQIYAVATKLADKPNFIMAAASILGGGDEICCRTAEQALF